MKSNQYDRLAPVYDKLARLVFGKQLFQAKTRWIPHPKSTESILIIGGGTGEILQVLLDRHPFARITYVEKSEKMIRKAKQRLSKSEKKKLQFYQIDFLEFESLSKYEMVITNFFLDQFEGPEIDLIISKIQRHLKPSGIWLFTDFDLGNVNSKPRWGSWLISLMFFFSI